MRPVKLHKPLLDAVRNGLTNIFINGSYADKEVQKILKSNKQYGSKDRSFIAETIYDIVRWKRNYTLKIETGAKMQEAGIDDLILLSLLQRNFSIQNPELLSSSVDPSERETWITDLDARNSFPEWLDERCFKELGNEWNAIAEALNVPAKVFIRINTLKTTAEHLLKLLEHEGIECVLTPSLLPFEKEGPFTCIEILSKNNLRNSKLYKEGLFEFQDTGSQAIGEFCDVQARQVLLDLCAGAGGKTLHLSALLNNTGKIYATDHNAYRLDNLQKRAQQAGCRNIEILTFQEAKKLKNIDILLIDAPCSGLGTIKRHPDIKWKLKKEDIDRYIDIQASLLEEHKNLIREHGKIIYATCSILPAESEEQISKFLQKNPDYILRQELRIHPQLHHCDGFYMAELRRRQ